MDHRGRDRGIMISQIDKKHVPFLLLGVWGEDNEKSILWLSEKLGIKLQQNPPNQEIQDMQKEVFGFEWQVKK